jgi:alpha-glucosidase
MLEQRYELLPYVYSLVAEASRTGAPVLRPLVYEFQSDPSVYALDDQAMLGPYLLAAPVAEQGAAQRTVRLPGGRWYELHSGAIYQGPVTLQLQVTLAALPLYVREGAILPRGQSMLWSDQHPIDPLWLDVYPSAQESSFTLYEDEGDGFGYEQGVYSRVQYRVQQTATGARLIADKRQGTYAAAPRGLLVRVRRVDHGPGAVTMDGVSLAPHADEGALKAAGKGWWYDARDLSLWIAHPEQDGFVLEASYDTSIPELRPPVQVELEVTVPAGTLAVPPVHVATSAGGWSHEPLGWSGTPELARGLVSVPRGEWFWYKYTRGDWETVEKWPGCAEATNRYGFGAAHPTRKDTVYVWRDWCP